MRKTFVCTTISIVCGLSAAAIAGMEPRVPETPIALDPGVLFLRHLSAGEEHRYQLPLAEGELARIVVEQEGIDLVVKVRDADEEEIDEFQDEVRPRGTEDVAIVAARPGTFTLTIAAGEGAISRGLYTI